MNRRAFLGAALAAAASPAIGAPEPRAGVHDFDLAARWIDEGYAYFDDESRARWRKVRVRARRAALRATTPRALAAALQDLVDALRDDNVTIAGGALPPARRIPYDLDMWPRWHEGVVAIEAVRTFSDADVAGVHAGMTITRVQEVAIDRAARAMLGGESASAADVEWALRRIMAGPRRGVQRVEVREGARALSIDIERGAPAPSTAPPILGRRMGDTRDIGYVRVRLGAADPDLVAHLEGALGYMSGTRALIVDLRETAGPSTPEISGAILAKLTSSASSPPLLVLVDRWTAGQGEQLAMELERKAAARIVGTETAGLRGKVQVKTLPASGIALSFPASRFDAPARPHVRVDLAAPSGGPGDPILYQALKLVERR